MPAVPSRGGARARLRTFHLLLLRVPGLTVQDAPDDEERAVEPPRGATTLVPLAIGLVLSLQPVGSSSGDGWLDRVEGLQPGGR